MDSVHIQHDRNAWSHTVETVLPPIWDERELNDSSDVTSYLELWQYRYYFHVIDIHEYESEIKNEMAKQLRPFAESLGRDGQVLRAFARRALQAFEEEILRKAWPEIIRKQMLQDIEPFMIVTENEFSSFDPRYHSWGILWLSGLEDNIGAMSRIFHRLSQLSHDHGTGMFVYLERLAQTQQAKRFVRYVTATDPKFFGISISVKALLDDLGSA